MKFSNLLLGLGLGLFAGSAVALSLGEAHGNVVLGKPIDLVFDIQTDPGIGLDIACISASAFAGETRIDSSRLRITARPVVAGRPFSVRIQSSVVVVEPILTMHLSLNCLGGGARSYDFLADAPSEASSRTAPLVLAPTKLNKPPKDETLPPKPAPVISAAAQPSAKSPTAAQQRIQLAAQPQSTKPAEQSPALPLPAPARLPTATSPLLNPPQVLLEIPSEPQAQAVALLPTLLPTITLPEQEVQQTQARLQQQQAEIDAGRASREKLQRTVTDLQQRLDQRDSDSYPAMLVYALLALLVVAFALLAGLWLRLRTQMASQSAASDKNRPETFNAKSFSPHPDNLAEADVPAPRTSSPPVPAPVSKPSPLLTKELRQAAAPAPVSATPPPVSLVLPPAAPALVPAVRMLHPEELFDLQQQAEFFVSVGEYDQAIEVMKKHIAENVTASPLMYLELLRLYHSLSRRDDFKHLGAQFQQHFNALVPEFSVFQEGGRTLLDYPEAAASIEAIWSDTAVLPLLENYIFCRNDGQSATVERFELPAYDDLLLLYAVANTTPASARGAPPPRQRTTPYADPARMVDSVTIQDLPVLSNLMDYDTSLLSEKATPSSLAQPPVPSAKGNWDLDLGLNLDLDLSSATRTPAPSEDQPLEFGAMSEHLEAQFRLDNDKKSGKH